MTNQYSVRKARRHFKRSLHWRFGVEPDKTYCLEQDLMTDLFMGRLNVLEEEDRGLKIHFPAVDQDCILIFSKSANVFITAYKMNKTNRQRVMLNGRIYIYC